MSTLTVLMKVKVWTTRPSREVITHPQCLVFRPVGKHERLNLLVHDEGPKGTHLYYELWSHRSTRRSGGRRAQGFIGWRVRVPPQRCPCSVSSKKEDATPSGTPWRLASEEVQRPTHRTPSTTRTTHSGRTPPVYAPTVSLWGCHSCGGVPVRRKNYVKVYLLHTCLFLLSVTRPCTPDVTRHLPPGRNWTRFTNYKNFKYIEWRFSSITIFSAKGVVCIYIHVCVCEWITCIYELLSNTT